MSIENPLISSTVKDDPNSPTSSTVPNSRGGGGGVERVKSLRFCDRTLVRPQFTQQVSINASLKEENPTFNSIAGK